MQFIRSSFGCCLVVVSFVLFIILCGPVGLVEHVWASEHLMGSVFCFHFDVVSGIQLRPARGPFTHEPFPASQIRVVVCDLFLPLKSIYLF